MLLLLIQSTLAITNGFVPSLFVRINEGFGLFNSILVPPSDRFLNQVATPAAPGVAMRSKHLVKGYLHCRPTCTHVLLNCTLD